MQCVELPASAIPSVVREYLLTSHVQENQAYYVTSWENCRNVVSRGSRRLTILYSSSTGTLATDWVYSKMVLPRAIWTTM
jgi:hypothetical protein